MEAMARLAAVGVTAVVLSAVLKKNTPEVALLPGCGCWPRRRWAWERRRP